MTGLLQQGRPATIVIPKSQSENENMTVKTFRVCSDQSETIWSYLSSFGSVKLLTIQSAAHGILFTPRHAVCASLHLEIDGPNIRHDDLFPDRHVAKMVRDIHYSHPRVGRKPESEHAVSLSRKIAALSSL